MATYTLTAGQTAAHAKATVGAAVDTVTFPVNCGQVEIISDGAFDLYITTDGSTPTVAGAATWRLPVGLTSVRVLPCPVSGGVTVIKLISSGITTYSVSGPV